MSIKLVLSGNIICFTVPSRILINKGIYDISALCSEEERYNSKLIILKNKFNKYRANVVISDIKIFVHVTGYSSQHVDLETIF